MKLTISGKDADIGSITFSEKGFGKLTQHEEVPYSIILSIDEFSNQFCSIYDDCIAELIQDDNIIGSFHPPYDGATRYPSFEEFLSIPELHRMQMVDTYFVIDILRLYVSEDIFNIETKWRVRSLSSLSLYDGIISIGGGVVKC